MNPKSQDNPVSMAKQILEIDSRLKEEIKAIQEILSLLVTDKLDLNKLKKMAKDHIAKLANEQE